MYNTGFCVICPSPQHWHLSVLHWAWVQRSGGWTWKQHSAGTSALPLDNMWRNETYIHVAPVDQKAYTPLRRNLFCFWSQLIFENSFENVDWFRYSTTCIKVWHLFPFLLRKEKVIFNHNYHLFCLQIPYFGQEYFLFFLLILVLPQAMLPSLEIMNCKVSFSKQKKKITHFLKEI